MLKTMEQNLNKSLESYIRSLGDLNDTENVTLLANWLKSLKAQDSVFVKSNYMKFDSQVSDILRDIKEETEKKRLREEAQEAARLRLRNSRK